MHGFEFLDSFRTFNPWSGNPEPLGLDLLFSYCNSQGLDEEQQFDFLRIIPAMDIKYREWLISKKPAPSKKPRGKS